MDSVVDGGKKKGRSKSEYFLGRLLILQESQSLCNASKMVAAEVKAVWLHHFGPKMVFWKEFGKDHSDEKLIRKSKRRL